MARIVAVALVAWCVVAWVAARSLIVTADLPRADVLVVLSGSSAYVERTEMAAQLWKAGRAPEIVLTNDGQKGGWSSSEQRNPFFVERAATELSLAGVPSARVIALPQVVSGTYDEVVLVRQYAESRSLHSILFVTSAYHSRRTLWTVTRVFAGTGINIGVQFVPPGQQTPLPAVWWLSVGGWRVVAGEYAKLIYYKLWFH
jgi:uncharacterized SAM-binding protein YcdF (DUF218 family)